MLSEQLLTFEGLQAESMTQDLIPAVEGRGKSTCKYQFKERLQVTA